MNSDKRSACRSGNAPAAERGNAMIYILLAIALLGALTMTMMRGNETGGDDLSKDEAELLATQVIAYAGSAKQVVDNMIASGTPVASLNFVTPNQSSFDTGSNIHKVFHPSGGGLNYKAADSKIFTFPASTPPAGWYVGLFNNVQWTPTSSNDVIMTALYINKPICQAINKKITGNITIPTHSDVRRTLIDNQYHGLGNVNFTVASSTCPSCSGFPSLCVSESTGTYFIYYSILSPQ